MVDLAGSRRLKLLGRFMAGGREDRPCLSVSFDARGAVIDVEGAPPAPGTEMVVDLKGVGSFQAVAREARLGGLRADFACTAGRRDRILSRIDWLLGEGGVAVENRSDARFVPIHTAVRLVIGEGVTQGTVVDVSRTGASIAVDGPRPGEGTNVTVGLRRASVVRHTEAGFAVRFAMPLPMNSFDVGIVL